MVFGLRLLIHVSLKGFVWEVYGLLICRDYVKLLIEHTTSSLSERIPSRKQMVNFRHDKKIQDS